jgi:hypothetical protein
VSANTGQAQEADLTEPSGPTILTEGNWSPIGPAPSDGSENYTNAFVRLDSLFDLNVPLVQQVATGPIVQSYDSPGGQIGAGLQVNRRSKRGQFSIAYEGTYVRYAQSDLGNGTNQNLLATYSRVLSRRWTLKASERFFLSRNLNTVTPFSSNSGLVLAMPLYNQNAQFSGTALTAQYQGGERWTYFATGKYESTVYQTAGLIDSFITSGSTGVSYRVNRRLTLTPSGIVSETRYSGIVGRSTVETGTLALSYAATKHTELGIRAGMSNQHNSTQLITNSLNATGATLMPVITASVFHTTGRLRLGLSGGEGPTTGSGLYTISKNIFVEATGSYQVGRYLYFSARFNHSGLISSSTSAYSVNSDQYEFTASRKLHDHVFARCTFLGWRTPQIDMPITVNTQRFLFGVTFVSHDYPLSY